MAPPPVTPSPHRFVATTKGPKAPCSIGTQDLSSRQFAPTPKFSSASLKKHASADASSLWPPQSSSSPLVTRRIVQHPTPPKWKGEEIEEASSDAETYEASVFPNTFAHTAHKDAENSTTNILNAFSPLPDSKRRRLIPPTHHEAIPISSVEEPSSPPTTPPPQQQTHATHTTLRRFVSAPAAKTGPLSPSLPTRPPFILPPSSPPPMTIPPAFSPHRRGINYTPGGLAATAFEWVLEASQTSYNNTRSRSIESTEAWDIEIAVDEFRKSERMLLVRERGTGRGWLLTGGGANGEDLINGCVIGIRKPVWEVNVEGEIWVVGVEWRNLGKG